MWDLSGQRLNSWGGGKASILKAKPLTFSLNLVGAYAKKIALM